MDKMPAKQRKSAKFRIVIKSYNTRARKKHRYRYEADGLTITSKFTKGSEYDLQSMKERLQIPILIFFASYYLF